MAIARLDEALFQLLIRTVKAAHVSRLDFPRRRQAIKITRCGRTSPPQDLPPYLRPRRHQPCVAVH